MIKSTEIFLLTSLLYLTSFSQTSDYIWTFDCNSQSWGEFNHSLAFNSVHKMANEHMNSGHLEFTNKAGNNSSWLFGPHTEEINTDDHKYVHFSLSLDNAGTIPKEGIHALFVWDVTTDGVMNDLKTQGFKLYSGKHIYTLDLNGNENWKGMVNINRIHFPQGDFTSQGYTPETAVYRLDWLSISSESNPKVPVQDTSSACLAVVPVLSSPESVVFGNRASMKVEVEGGIGEVRLKLWSSAYDTIYKSQQLSGETAMYFSTFNLNRNTNYSWQMEITNPLGRDVTELASFETEEKTAEEMPDKFWMTPSPFKLIQNVNDHLFDQSNWEDAAKMVGVYKIHGAYFSSHDSFEELDLPKLIYAVNKNRMRLAWETIVAGDRDGAAYAKEIISKIEEIGELGGKLEYLTWDGMMFRCFYDTHTHTKFRTPEAGLEAVAEAAKLVQDKYPDFEIIPLPNLPNWDFKGISHNAGDWAAMTGVSGWDYLCDIYLQKAKQKGVTSHFIQIDHPFNYYHRISREQSKQRIATMQSYCEENDMELIHIINTAGITHTSEELIDAQFKDDCLQYIKDLREDGIEPKYIDVESWYPYPQYLTPETKENSFTNVLRDVGILFLDSTDVSADHLSIGSDLANTSVYPNPTSRSLYVQLPQNAGRVSMKLLDIGGTVLKNAPEVLQGRYTFNLEQLAGGIYFLQIQSGEGIRTWKVLKSE